VTNHLFALGPPDGGRFTWVPSPLLLTHANTLQGGAGLGAATTAMEAITGRPVVWATAQYLSFAFGEEPIDIDVTIEVPGHKTTQARCVVSRHRTEILTAHAALGERDIDFEGVWCAPPAVPEPDDCPPYPFFERGRGHLGDLVEFRLARGRQVAEIVAGSDRGDGSFALWVRCWSGDHMMTVSDVAFIGDFMPLGFADAMGQAYLGNSLDNTIRLGNLTTTKWVLLSAHVQQIARGYGYGRAELWAQDGALLGEVSQTVLMRTRARILDPRGPRRS
jgi:acyl-CoA thioesterase-2